MRGSTDENQGRFRCAHLDSEKRGDAPVENRSKRETVSVLGFCFN